MLTSKEQALLKETFNTNYRFIDDPGHGWLEVSIDELWKLGILDRISAYSYCLDDMAYLEEDMDMETFIHAKVSNDVAECQDWYTNHVTREYQANTPIRNYRSIGTIQSARPVFNPGDQVTFRSHAGVIVEPASPGYYIVKFSNNARISCNAQQLTPMSAG